MIFGYLTGQELMDTVQNFLLFVLGLWIMFLIHRSYKLEREIAKSKTVKSEPECDLDHDALTSELLEKRMAGTCPACDKWLVYEWAVRRNEG